MSGESDGEEELLRALRAPGTKSELGQEAEYRALFRARASADAAAPGAVRRAGATTVRRLGTGSALAVTFAVASAGVAAAAAYSSHLPDPVQQAVHRLLAPIGVPPAHPTDEDRAGGHRPPGRSDAPAPSNAASPSSSPTSPAPTPSRISPTEGADAETGSAHPHTSTDPSGHGETSHPSASASQPGVVPPPPASSSSSPTSEPTTTSGPRPRPAGVSIGATVHRVDPGEATLFTGMVTDGDGAGLEGVRVVLQRLVPGGWTPVGFARSAAGGSVSVSAPPAGQTVRYRFRVRRHHSPGWRLALQPVLAASGTTARRTVSVTVTTQGGQSGDRVLLVVRRDHRPVVVADTLLGADGQADLSLVQKRPRQRYLVVLVRTRLHTRARESVVITRATRAGQPAPSASAAPTPQSDFTGT